MAITYGLKYNLRLAFFGMINYVALANISEVGLYEFCPDNDSKSKYVLTEGPFLWAIHLQEIIFSSYYLGYLFSIFPGALLAENFSAKWTMFCAVLINVICTAMTPFSANLHYIMLIVMRIVAGIGGGLTFPAMHVLLSKWSLPYERTIMCAAVYSGTALGTSLSSIFTLLIESGLDWKWVFYIMATASAVWLPLWIGFVYDTPEKSPIITENEKSLIKDSVGDVYPESKFPAKAIFTSLPFWALLIAHTSISWVWYTLSILTFVYHKSYSKLAIASMNGYWFMVLWIASLIIAGEFHRHMRKETTTTTKARKEVIITCSIIAIICFVLLCLVGCVDWFTTIFISVGYSSVLAIFLGILPNHIELAPNHAGILVACTNFSATLPAILIPICVGALLEIYSVLFSWTIIFLVGIALCVLTTFMYVIFGSGDEQPWNDE
ncbi:sialin-like isoform X2 [Onthophagus taurus]